MAVVLPRPVVPTRIMQEFGMNCGTEVGRSGLWGGAGNCLAGLLTRSGGGSHTLYRISGGRSSQ